MVVRPARIPALRRAATLAVLTAALVGAVAPAATAAGSPTTSSPTAGPSLSRAATSGPATGPATGPSTAVPHRRVADAQDAYEQARATVATLSEQAARLRHNAELADAEAARLHEEVRHTDGGSLLDVLASLVGDGESDLDRAAEAADNAAHLTGLATAADQALRDAIQQTERTRLAWEEARADLAAVERQWTAQQAVAAFVRRSTFQKSYDVADPAQDRRNHAALRRWHAYLRSLGNAGVVPPPATKLRNPDRLPRALQIVRDDRGRVVLGVAATQTKGRVTVLPSETVRAVSSAFNRVGLSDVPGAIAPSTYACGGLVANAWSATDTLAADVTGQWRDLRTVPVSTLQLGDVVVLGGQKSGLTGTGVYVGERELIVADPTTGTAGVQRITRSAVHGVKRVGLPVARSYEGPAAGGACAPQADTGVADDGTAATTSGPFVLPLAAGSYSLSARFGATGSLWSSGAHSGLDFAAPVGTPVLAVGAGTVTLETNSWAGNLVRIDHGGGVETWYAHLSEVDVTDGQQIRRGQRIGAVGNEGNSTGPHLHLEVRLDGIPVDPALVLDVPGMPAPSYPNGEISTEALCSATADGGQELRCDAAVSLRMLAAAYEAETGAALCVTDSYRSRAGQELVFRTKPGLGAVPGTSLHGDGVAVDLCGGVESFGTAQHTWMAERGTVFGWGHPSWAAAGGPRPEPWHFEYRR